MNDLPRVYVNPIDHEVNNVQKSYVSFNNKMDKEENNRSFSNISLNKIDEILNNKHYIKKPNVKLITSEGDIFCKMISRTNSYVLTMDNKKIPINIIKDISVI